MKLGMNDMRANMYTVTEPILNICINYVGPGGPQCIYFGQEALV